MFKNIMCIFLLIIFVLAVLTGLAKQGMKQLPADQEQINEEVGAGEAAAEAQIEEAYYQKDGIEAYYPKFISGGSEKELQQWNQIIHEDFQKILNIYSFEPYPGPTPPERGPLPTILRIENKVTLNSDRFFSVLYKASFNSPYSAHPSESVYTTNIDKRTGKRLRLPEVLTIDKAFIEDFRGWKFIPFEEGNEELNKAIQDYINSLSDEDLLMGFQAADLIGSGNLWGIYSYLTPENLGISLSVPNYAGDHIEFERDYSQLLKYLKKY